MSEKWEFREKDFCFRCEIDDIPVIWWYATDTWYFTSLCERCLRELAGKLSEFTTKDEEMKK